MLNTQTTPTTNGNTTPNNGKITTSPTVRYLIQCKELGVCQEFTDFDTAHTFAAQLAQDFPTATIDRYKLTQTFDDWDNDTGTTQGGKL